MVALPLIHAHEPPARVVALHALVYCPQLCFLEEVEVIRIADAAVFAGRHLHATSKPMKTARTSTSNSAGVRSVSPVRSVSSGGAAAAISPANTSGDSPEAWRAGYSHARAVAERKYQ
jgi:hypothetical protein